MPPPAKAGHWMGYYVELFFPSKLAFAGVTDYQVTTPGFVWPDTYPFEDKPINQTTGQLV